MDGGAWKAAVHGVAEGRTRLSDFTFTFHFHALEKEMATHSCSCLENPRDGGAWWAAIYVVVKNLPANAGDARDAGSIPGRKIPWRRAWQTTLVFLPGGFHGQRNLMGYSP